MHPCRRTRSFATLRPRAHGALRGTAAADGSEYSRARYRGGTVLNAPRRRRRGRRTRQRPFAGRIHRPTRTVVYSRRRHGRGGNAEIQVRAPRTVISPSLPILWMARPQHFGFGSSLSGAVLQCLGVRFYRPTWEEG